MLMPRLGTFARTVTCGCVVVSRTSARAGAATAKGRASMAAAARKNLSFMAQILVLERKRWAVCKRALCSRSRAALPSRAPRCANGATKSKRAAERPFRSSLSANDRSALARLEARVALADHEHLAAATHDLAVAMALLCGLEGRQHFHGTPRNGFLGTENAEV